MRISDMERCVSTELIHRPAEGLLAGSAPGGTSPMPASTLLTAGTTLPREAARAVRSARPPAWPGAPAAAVSVQMEHAEGAIAHH